MTSEQIPADVLQFPLALIDFTEGRMRVPREVEAQLSGLSEVLDSFKKEINPSAATGWGAALANFRPFHMHNYVLLAPSLECVKRWDWRSQPNFRIADIFDFADFVQKESSHATLRLKVSQTSLFAGFVEDAFGAFALNTALDLDDSFCFFLSNLTRFGHVECGGGALFVYTRPPSWEEIMEREETYDELLLQRLRQIAIDFGHLAPRGAAAMPSVCPQPEKRPLTGGLFRGEEGEPLIGQNHFRPFEPEFVAPEADTEDLACLTEFWEMCSL